MNSASAIMLLNSSGGNQAPGLLSLSLPSVEIQEWVPGKSWGVNRHIAWYSSPYPWFCSVGWFLAEGLAEISADIWEAVAH